MAKLKKLTGEFITHEDIRRRKARSMGMGYPVPAQWVLFCEEMLKIGYAVSVKETLNTYSKYITVHGAGDTNFKVRFSDHKPNRRREINGDCDYFVGRTHTGARTTAMAVLAVKDFFNAL